MSYTFDVAVKESKSATPSDEMFDSLSEAMERYVEAVQEGFRVLLFYKNPRTGGYWEKTWLYMFGNDPEWRAELSWHNLDRELEWS